VAKPVHFMFQPLATPEVVVITPPRHGDERGCFPETATVSNLAETGIPGTFVQDNQSFSRAAGTIQDPHCQSVPSVQGGLERVLRGTIRGVAVDARPGPATFGQFIAAEPCAETVRPLGIPPGFLHGFCHLVPDTDIFHNVSALHDRVAERGVIWHDTTLVLPWSLPATGPMLSAKDQKLRSLEAAMRDLEPSPRTLSEASA
jgi:dTDP-4-dehydrorhamnose 3,5-epimerase